MVTGKTVSFEQAMEAVGCSPIFRRECERVPRADHGLREKFCSPNKAPMAVGHIKRSVPDGAEASAGQTRSRSNANWQSCLLQERRCPKKASPGLQRKARFARFKNKIKK